MLIHRIRSLIRLINISIVFVEYYRYYNGILLTVSIIRIDQYTFTTYIISDKLSFV